METGSAKSATAHIPTVSVVGFFSATVCDDTSTTWVSLFNEQAETLFGGVTADEVYNTTMGDVMDQDAYDSYFAKANHTEWIFKCKVKQEMVNDESRVKTSVVAMHPVDYVKESQDLLAAIEQF
jgi:replication factor A1